MIKQTWYGELKGKPINYARFVLDHKSDLALLPNTTYCSYNDGTEDGPVIMSLEPEDSNAKFKTCSVGSQAFCLENKTMYVLNNQDEWVAFRGGSTGGGGNSNNNNNNTCVFTVIETPSTESVYEELSRLDSGYYIFNYGFIAFGGFDGLIPFTVHIGAFQLLNYIQDGVITLWSLDGTGGIYIYKDRIMPDVINLPIDAEGYGSSGDMPVSTADEDYIDGLFDSTTTNRHIIFIPSPIDFYGSHIKWTKDMYGYHPTLEDIHTELKGFVVVEFATNAYDWIYGVSLVSCTGQNQKRVMLYLGREEEDIKCYIHDPQIYTWGHGHFDYANKYLERPELWGVNIPEVVYFLPHGEQYYFYNCFIHAMGIEAYIGEGFLFTYGCVPDFPDHFTVICDKGSFDFKCYSSNKTDLYNALITDDVIKLQSYVGNDQFELKYNSKIDEFFITMEYGYYGDIRIDWYTKFDKLKFYSDIYTFSFDGDHVINYDNYSLNHHVKCYSCMNTDHLGRPVLQKILLVDPDSEEQYGIYYQKIYLDNETPVEERWIRRIPSGDAPV